jgi:hypothetical protein
MSLVDKINSVNEFGIAQLAAHGVEIPSPPTLYPAPPDPDLITTYDIMAAISMISSGGGGGIEYTSITCNEDNTITLVDVEGVTHNMSYNLTDDKITSITFDGTTMVLQYDGDALTKLNAIELDFKNIPDAPDVPDVPDVPDPLIQTTITTAVVPAACARVAVTAKHNNIQITANAVIESEE